MASSSIAPVAYLGSWALVASALATRFHQSYQPILTEVIASVEDSQLPFQCALRDARALLPEIARDAIPPFESLLISPPEHVQQRLSDKLASSTFDQLVADVPTDEARARLRSVAGPGAGAWITASPIIVSLQMAPDLYTTAIRTRLGLSHPGLQGHLTCICGHSMDAQGTHLLRCPRGGERTAAHDAVRDAIAAIASESSYRVSREQSHQLPLRGNQTRGGRVDLLFTSPESRILGDVVIADPTRLDLVQRAARSDGTGHAAHLAAAQKIRDYEHRHLGDDFIPFAIETYGTLDAAFNDFLRECARRACEARGSAGPPRSVLVASFRQRISGCSPASSGTMYS